MLLLRSIVLALFLAGLSLLPGSGGAAANAGAMHVSCPLSHLKVTAHSTEGCVPVKSTGHAPGQTCCVGAHCTGVGSAVLPAQNIDSVFQTYSVPSTNRVRLEGRSVSPETGPPRIVA